MTGVRRLKGKRVKQGINKDGEGGKLKKIKNRDELKSELKKKTLRYRRHHIRTRCVEKTS